MWYDELKSVSTEILKEYNIDNLVIPVVWKYTSNLDTDLPSEMWRNLSYSFKEVWGGSAFKGVNLIQSHNCQYLGADGANSYWNRLKPYIMNNKEWYLQNEKYKSLFVTFDTIVVTGWQRFANKIIYPIVRIITNRKGNMPSFSLTPDTIIGENWVALSEKTQLSTKFVPS